MDTVRQIHAAPSPEECKILIYEGNSHKFAARDWGCQALADMFWYPTTLRTKIALIVLVENTKQADFFPGLWFSSHIIDASTEDCSESLLVREHRGRMLRGS